MKRITGIMISALLCGAFCGNMLHGSPTERTTVYATSVGTNTKDIKGLDLHAKSAYLCDYATGTEIYALNETARLPIASMCKIMTLTLCFDAINEGVMTMDEEITVSERAASMGGSQVFLEANAKYPVRELMKSIVVCSANDSCVALAEKIAGNETAFTDKMNEKVRSLGLSNTLFANCTGLPRDPQYSCAKDVAVMLKALLANEEYYEFGRVWLDKFQHPQGRYTEITNTNKLVRFYDGCDGGKTGFTNQAGFCLAATAKRNDMRIISVVIGEENSANRFDDVRSMFDYAFAN
jgi:D-alanyl-D-alanine carboxypeptidase (penicillin-binding protein 5/6)